MNDPFKFGVGREIKMDKSVHNIKKFLKQNREEDIYGIFGNHNSVSETNSKNIHTDDNNNYLNMNFVKGETRSINLNNTEKVKITERISKQIPDDDADDDVFREQLVNDFAFDADTGENNIKTGSKEEKDLKSY